MIYGHPVDFWGVMGILTVFLSLGLRIKDKSDSQKAKALAEARK